ncbi:hypothetical protein [Aeromonas dhakensis]|uniref:hypothetical protein n=1 Tax=Aeromonas dhakensis TaxID=196024 RepID=UPI00198071EB|nr:hypothetical protein [Aeromonas dhakensis]MBW3731010.1 hypothetical protein [Aeromonas dhakensis]QSR55660.1 hypothetical protein GO601_09665 [Aeromonas dhakensis]HDZ8841762.1 hypothetical protein [Aeromonas dhakensis]
MKSHDFAKQLTMMAKILKNGPNVELHELNMHDFKYDSYYSPKTVEQNDIPKALSMLVGLNEVSKSQWIDFISDYELPIDIRQRDATRDIIGKLLNYLSQNREARERLSGRKNKRVSNSSSDLADALSILLT